MFWIIFHIFFLTWSLTWGFLQYDSVWGVVQLCFAPAFALMLGMELGEKVYGRKR